MFTPSIVPATGETVYIVEDYFGPKLGQAYRETDAAHADRETTLGDLFTGQCNDPVSFIAFNCARGLVARCLFGNRPRIQRRAELDGTHLDHLLAAIVEQYAHAERQIALRLA